MAERPPNIPPSVLEKRRKREAPMDVDGDDDDSVQPPPAKRPMTMRERELAEGDDFYLNLRDHWLLKNPHERNDIIPEIMDGHNIADFFDPDIEAKLNELEEEEKALEEAGLYDEEEDPDDTDPKMQELRATAKKCVFFSICSYLSTLGFVKRGHCEFSNLKHGKIRKKDAFHALIREFRAIK